MTSVSTLFNRISLRRHHSWTSRIIVGSGIGLTVLALLFANSPTAQGYSVSNTNEVETSTGGGGYIGPANCADGSVIYEIGASGSSSNTSLTRPTGNCVNLNNTATAHNSVTGSLSTTNWGGAGDTSLTATRCTTSEAVVGVVAHKQANGYVSGWQLMCGTLPDGSSRTTSPTVFGWSNAGTSSPSQRETIQCPTGMVAVGMVAHVGGIMDRVGFRCGTITGADQATVSMSSSSTITYGTSMTVTANGGSGNGAISYSASGSCTLSGSTLTATGNAGATCSVSATRAGNTNYNAGTSATQTVTIQRAANTITFANPGTKTWSATPFNVAPTATSGITPSVTSTTPSVCSVSGLSVTMLSSGTCSLTATQGETTNHVAAVAVVQSFTINSTGRTAFTGNSATISGTTTGTKYVVERFTTTGASTWTVPQGVARIDLLVIGGGGGGGSRHRGGGGAGAYLEGTNYAVTPGTTYNVTVGSGGAGGINAGDGSSGTASQFLTGGVGATANGGGGGLYNAVTSAASGSGTGLTLYANSGGNGLYGTCVSPNWCGGGGGGAGAAGSNAVTTGGNGGNGRASFITGTNITYAGGGGGGGGSSSGASCANATPGGSGGTGGGGAGASASGGTAAAGTAGTANTGSGGGGGGYCNDPNGSATGGAGGSGIVVLRYVLPVSATPDLATASDSGTSTTDNITTNRTLTFTGSAPVTATVQLSVATATSATDTDVSTGTWTNTGSTCTADSTSGAWSCTTAQLAPGLYKVRSTSTTAMDGITDTQTSSTALVVEVDTTSPTIALTRSGSGALTAGQTETITFTLSEASSTFAADDITFTGGTISSLTTTSSTV